MPIPRLRIFLPIFITLWLLGPMPAWGEAPVVGKPAPEFKAKTDNGKLISLKDLRGKWVVLYFYPKDDTPGCTIEAKSFRDLYSQFQKKGVIILGVSYDTLDSHQAFKRQYEIPYSLVADQDRKISKAYGVAGPYFADRTTYIIDPDGVLAKIYPNVNPSHHAKEVMDFFNSPQANKKIH